MRIGIALFEGAEELDFAGPWEVLAAWANQWPDDNVEVFTVSDGLEPVRCAKGLRVVPDHTWDTAGRLDVLVYPGGMRGSVQDALQPGPHRRIPGVRNAEHHGEGAVAAVAEVTLEHRPDVLGIGPGDTEDVGLERGKPRRCPEADDDHRQP